MAEQIQDGERLRVPVQFLDAKNKAEPVDAPKASSSDETVATAAFDTNGDLLVTRVGVGKATITVSADADVSPVTDTEISNTLDVECPAVMADHVVFGAAVHEPAP